MTGLDKTLMQVRVMTLSKRLPWGGGVSGGFETAQRIESMIRRFFVPVPGTHDMYALTNLPVVVFIGAVEFF